MIKNKYLAYALYVAAFIAFWNAADFVCATWITRSGYHFSALRELVEPLLVGAEIGYFAILRGRKKDE